MLLLILLLVNAFVSLYCIVNTIAPIVSFCTKWQKWCGREGLKSGFHFLNGFTLFLNSSMLTNENFPSSESIAPLCFPDAFFPSSRTCPKPCVIYNIKKKYTQFQIAYMKITLNTRLQYSLLIWHWNVIRRQNNDISCHVTAMLEMEKEGKII